MTRSDLCIDQLFRDARTHNGWLDKPVSDKTLREVYDALKWGPTSANASRPAGALRSRPMARLVRWPAANMGST